MHIPATKIIHSRTTANSGDSIRAARQTAILSRSDYRRIVAELLG